jgi:hypothetical protein
MRRLHPVKGFKTWARRPNVVLRAAMPLLAIGAAALALGGDGALKTRVLEVFAIVVLSTLPGWLFLRFVTVRTQSVWDEYVLNLHRLGMDLPEHLPRPPVNSIYYQQWVDHHGPRYEGQPSLYRDKFDAYYGKTTAPDARATAQLKPETFFPVLLATAVIAAGWAAVVGGRSFSATPLGSLSTGDMMRLAFVGAYLFTLQMLVRRYFQADLKASAYVNAVTRIVTSLSLVLVVDLSLPETSTARIAIAFIIGFFPLVGLQFMQKAAAVALRTVVPSLRNDYPLSDLDGLSVWYEARLLELGIEDMENLATANLVDVTLHSRVPVSRLVDWVDQAHLYLHLEPKKADTPSKSRDTLRRLGIRTATGLEDALRPGPAGAGAAHGLVSAEANAQLIKDLRRVLNPEGLAPSVTTSLLKTFEHDPNLKHVRHWRRDWTRPVVADLPVREPVMAAGSNGNGAGPH